MMRVLLLVDALTIGGLPNYVLDLARALSESGDAVAVAHGGDAPPSHLDVAGVTLIALGADARAAIVGFAPDVVHVHLCSDPALLDVLASLDVPLVRSFHDYTSMCLRRGRRRYPGDRCQRALGIGCAAFGCVVGPPAAGGRLPRLLDLGAKLREVDRYRRFDAAVVGSRYMRGALIANGFASDRVRLVPYFSRFDPHAQGEAPLGPKPAGVPGVDRPLELMFAGQAVTGKGLLVLMRALVDLPGRWRLTAVTDGPDLGAARALAERAGFADRVAFTGWLAPAALAALYRHADLLIVPSIWDDPGPLVGIEAMAFETPVLGFPVGGIPDYAQDGITGFLSPAADASALTSTLRRALDAGASLAELGRAGRRMVATVHGRRRHVASIRDVYDATRRGGVAAPSRSNAAPIGAES